MAEHDVVFQQEDGSSVFQSRTFSATAGGVQGFNPTTRQPEMVTGMSYGSSGELGFFSASAVAQPSGSAQQSVTLVNTNGAIGGLTIGVAYNQGEVQALRNSCETLADDVRNIHTLLEALRTALVDLGLAKGGA